MALYLIQVGYTPEAWAAMAKKPQDRIEAVRPVVEKMGGKLLSGYLAFGEYDLIGIMDMPNNISAAAFAIAVAAGGAARLVTTPLMSTKDGMEAMKKAGGANYKPATARTAAKRK